MVETEVTLHNNIDIKVQAQIFVGRTLISTGLIAPGVTHMLPIPLTRYDIYLKNGATGWEITHKLDTESKSLTLAVHNGRYTLR